MKKEFFLLFFIAILFVVPVLWQSRNLIFRLDSDYDTHLPTFQFVVESVRSDKGFPLWNPYISTGVSLIGDPLSMVLNPLLTIPMIVFGVGQGLRLTLFFMVGISGISMWYLLNKLGVRGFLRLWGALLYQVSGALTANMAAGHIEKFLSYSLIPLFFGSSIMPSMKRMSILNASLVLTLIIFSGDFYALWFLSIFFLGIRGYYVVTRKESLKTGIIQTLGVYIACGVFSSVKLIPFLFDVSPRIERFSAIDPFTGSIHAFLSPLAFVMPLRVAFYDRPFFQRLLGFHFNWYEYYAFISPLSFLFLLKIKSILNNKVILLLIILLGIGTLYSALKYPYSPFHWLFYFVPAVRFFRVPQRIFAPMTTLLIGLLALCGQKWKRTPMIIICIVSLIWTFFVGQETMRIAFEKPRIAEEEIVHKLREKDPGKFTVTTFACCMQTFLVQEHIPILNYYHGWRLKNIANLRPKYIIAPKSMNFSSSEYVSFLENEVARVWLTL